jgi:hypothetical protein
MSQHPRFEEAIASRLKGPISDEEFSMLVIAHKKKYQIETTFDALSDFCLVYDIEEGTVPLLLTETLKARIREDAEALNLLPRHAKLDIFG